MEVSEFGFKLLLLFFPGILCAHLIDQLTVHRPRETIFFLLQSFVCGIASYFTYWAGVKIVSQTFPKIACPDVTFLRALTDSSTRFSFREIALVSLLAVVIACFISLASRFKLLNRVARKCGLTKKFGELDVWGYMLNMPEVVWVTLRDHKNNLIYDGWVQSFSDDSADAELLLRDVSVYKNDTGEQLYQVGAVYICRSREDISIECRTLPVDSNVEWKKEDQHEQRQEQQPVGEIQQDGDQ